MTNKETIQPVHNESVVQGIASEFWEKDISGENSLHTCPNGCTICSLCKVGATGELEDKLIYKKYTNERLDNEMHINNIKLINIYARTIEQFRLETDVLGSEVEVMLSLWNEFIRVMSWKLNQSFIDKFIEKWWIPPKLRLDNVIDS